MTKQQRLRLAELFWAYGECCFDFCESDGMHTADEVTSIIDEFYKVLRGNFEVEEKTKMTERQKDKLLFYITCLNGSAFNHGLEWGAEIFSKNERNISPINREELHNRDLDQLLSFVISIYEGDSHETT